MTALRCFSLHILFVASLLLTGAPTQAFVVRAIEIHHTGHVPPSTIRHHIHLPIGTDLTEEKSDILLKKLYKTGFFKSVQLIQKEHTLLVYVQENPVISLVKIDGNKEIKTQKMQDILKKIGLIPGRTYNPFSLEMFQKSLEQQYILMGYNTVHIETETRSLAHQLISVMIHVQENAITKINTIHITGCRAFSEAQLQKTMHMRASNLLSFLSHNNRFSKPQLDSDLERLIDWYMNHGYIHARIVSHDVHYTADQKHATLEILLEEGPLYTVSHFSVQGQTLGLDASIQKILSSYFTPHSIFVRNKVLQAQDAIKNLFSSRGYALSKINVVPSINNETHTVSLTFQIETGHPILVRRIEFSGNHLTNLEVIRREFRQMEAAPYSISDIRESRRRLMLTGFFENVDIQEQPVPEKTDQVDLLVHVYERKVGRFYLNGGYSTGSGFQYGFELSQPNFLGTGNYVALGFTKSQLNNNYYFTFMNPYYKWYGMSRGFTVFYNHTKYEKSFNFLPYVLNSWGGDLVYGLPVSENHTIHVKLGYTKNHVTHMKTSLGLAPSILDFMEPDEKSRIPDQDLERTFDIIKISGIWTYLGIDRERMPTSGLQHTLSFEAGLPILTKKLTYYTITEHVSWYLPIKDRGWIINILADLGYGRAYGDSNTSHLYPFFKNFYAGGIGSVPGFEPNSLGPKYGKGTPFENLSLGGNLLTTAGAHLILPNFFNDQLRIALTFDIGAVFQSPVYAKDSKAVFTPPQKNPDDPQKELPLVVNNYAFAFEHLRSSVGILFLCYLPVFNAPVDISLAWPVHKEPYDQTENFQFTLGFTF